FLRSLSFPHNLRRFAAFAAFICAGLLLSACGAKVIKETSAEPRIEKPKPPSAVPMWLGNPARTFFGTGPMPTSLKVEWDFTTGWSRGRLHNDPWGGSGWPG